MRRRLLLVACLIPLVVAACLPWRWFTIACCDPSSFDPKACVGGGYCASEPAPAPDAGPRTEIGP